MNDEWLEVGSLAALVVMKLYVRAKRSRDQSTWDGHGSFGGGVNRQGETVGDEAIYVRQTIRRTANG